MSSKSNGGGGKQQLWRVIGERSDELLQRINANGKMLSSLSKSGLISRADERKLETQKDPERRNSELLQLMLENESKVPDAFDKFIDALNASDQTKLASSLKSGGNQDDRNGRRPASPPQQKDNRSRDGNRDDRDRRDDRGRDDRDRRDDRGDRDRDDRNPGKPKAGTNKSSADDPQTEMRRSNSKVGAPATGAGSQQSRSRSMGDPTGRRPPDVTEERNGRQPQQPRHQSVSPDRSSRQPADDDRDQRSNRDPPTNRRRDDFDYDTGVTGNHAEHSQKIIDRLRKDCEEVAKKNANLIDRLRQVEGLLSKVNPVGVGSNGDKLSRDGAGGHMTSRNDETERYMSLIQDHVNAIATDKKDTDQQVAASETVIEKLRNEVAERNMALVSLDENDEEAFRQRKRVQPLTPTSSSHGQLPATTHQMSTSGGVVGGPQSSRVGQLRSKIVNLSSEIDAYVHREKQHTMVPRWPGREPGTHRNFDQVDHDFNVLMRELRQNDRHSSIQSIQRLADVTKTEREDCVRICDDIQRLVQKRRTKIQELLQQFQKQLSGSSFVSGSGSRKNDQIKTSPVLQRKVRTTRSVESCVSRRLVELGDEIKLCIEYEFDYNQKVRDDIARRRLDVDERQRAVTLDLKRLERRAKEAEIERDRYRRLYEQAQVVQLSRLLTKPTVVKRSKSKSVGGRRANTVALDGLSLPTINRRGSDEDPIPSQSLFVGTRNKQKRAEEDENNNNDDDDGFEDDYGRLRRSEPSWYSRQSDLGNDDGRDGHHHHQKQLKQQQQPNHQVAVHLQTRSVQNRDGIDQSPSPQSQFGDPHRSDERQSDEVGKRQHSPKQRDDDHARDRRDGNGYRGNGHSDDTRRSENKPSQSTNDKNHGNGSTRHKGYVRTIMDVVEDY